MQKSFEKNGLFTKFISDGDDELCGVHLIFIMLDCNK